MEGDNNEGCKLKGHVRAPLADGNIHFAPSRDVEHAMMPWQQVLSYTFQVNIVFPPAECSHCTFRAWWCFPEHIGML